MIPRKEFACAALLLLLAVMAGMEVGCSPTKEGRVVRIREKEARWFRADDAWIHSVDLKDPLTIQIPRGRLFRAMAFPGGAKVALTIRRSGSTERTIPIPEKGVPVEIRGRTAERITLVARGKVSLLVPRFSPPHRRGKRIYMIVNDALRYDAARPDTMPETVDFFRRGRIYTAAFSAASWTLPSVASLMTGRKPVALRMEEGTLIAMPPGFPTLAERMRSNGMVCFGYCANYTINHENNYTRGFDAFTVPTVLGHGEKPDVTWLIRHLRKEIAAFSDCDLFLYIHTMETHEPYRNHETGRAITVGSTGEAVEAERIDAAREAYRSEAHYLDHHLAGLLRETNPSDTIIVTADHGEEFMEHGGLRHGPTLYDEVVHVPLMIRGHRTEAKEITRPVSLRGIYAWLVAGDSSAPIRSTEIAMETFAHAPPRWSWIGKGGRIILFAFSPGFEPQDVTGRWLMEHHPAKAILPIPGSDRKFDRKELLRRAPSALARYFTHYRRGVWIYVKGEPAEGVVPGVDKEILVWGSPKSCRIEIRRGAAHFRVAVPDIFCLIFFPTGGAAPNRVEGENGFTAIPLHSRPPVRFPDRGTVAWWDPGSPPRTEEALSKTLQRLRALGYIQ